MALRKLLVAHILGSPLGGAGTASAVTERARHSAVREKRFAVSLAFFHALRAHKVKGKVAPFLKKRRPKKLYARYRSAPAAHVRYSLDEHERQRAAIGAN